MRKMLVLMINITTMLIADDITVKYQGTLILLGVSVGFVAGWEEFDLSFLVRSHSIIMVLAIL